jgi:hypothetical protein
MKITGRKLRNNVNFERDIKGKKNEISECDTKPRFVVTFAMTSI